MAVVSTLDKLAEDHEMNTKTISEATGLFKRIRDINFVVSLHVLDKIFTITFPVTIILRGVSIDLAAAAHLLEICKTSISNLRNNGDSTWEELRHLSIKFVEKHGIKTTTSHRKRKVARMTDDKCHDEVADDKQIRFKTGVYIVAL